MAVGRGLHQQSGFSLSATERGRSLAGKKFKLALVAGLGSLFLGTYTVLLPVYLPAGAYWLSLACYRVGGALVLAGGLTIDVSVLLILARFARIHLGRRKEALSHGA
jgi:hypothetical protein